MAKKLVADPEHKMDMAETIKSSEKMIVEYLLRAGWKHCWNPETKSMLWVGIYSSNHDGKCYAVPKVYACNDMDTACTIQGKWETNRLPTQM